MNKTKVGYLGSCLSSIPVASLVAQYNFEEVFRIHHNRSDAFRSYFVDKSQKMPDREWLDSKLGISEDPNLARDGTEFLDNQMLPHIGFEETLKEKRSVDANFFKMLETEKIDVILLDNFMDVASKLMSTKPDAAFSCPPLFINPHFYKNREQIERDFVFGEFLTAKESAQNWLHIYKWFRHHQPEAKIIFLCFPYATSRSTLERYNRARDFYIEFNALCEGEDIDVVAPLHVVDELTNGKGDWYHVKPPLYQALAGYIYLRAVAHFPGMNKPYQGHLLEDHELIEA